MPPQEPQLTEQDKEAAALLRRMLEAQAKLDAEAAAKAQAPKTTFHQRALGAGLQVVKPIPSKGGYVYKDPKTGKLQYLDAGYSTTDQAEIVRILDGESPKNSMGPTEYLAGARREIPKAIRTEAEKALIEKEGLVGFGAMSTQGFPFLGTYGDELMGTLTGTEGATETVRAVQEAYQNQKPLEAFGGQLGVGAAGTIAAMPLLPLLGIGAGGAAGAGAAGTIAPTLGQKMLTGLGVGVLAGSTEGAVSGYGAGEGSFEERLPSAGTGAAFGAVTGGVIGTVAPPVVTGVKNVLEYWGDKPVREMAKQFGISESAAKVVLANIKEGDIATAQAALQRAGSTSMLAEITPATKNLLDLAMASGPGGDQAAAAILARNIRGEQEMRGAFDRFLGKPEDLVDVQGNIRKGTAAQRKALYDSAYGATIDYSTVGGKQLQNWLQFVPPEALAYANKIRSMDPEARAAPAINTPGTPRTALNVEQWDLITRGLNEMAYGSPAGVMGGKSEVQALAAKNAREIRKLLMEQVPEYRAALGLARDTIEEVKSAEIGFNLLSGSTTVKEVTDMLSGQSPAVAQSMKLGLRSGLDHTLGNLRVAAANPNTEVKELTAALSQLRSRNNMAKVRALLGDKDADEFYRILDEQATGVELAAAVAQNSKTFQRTANAQMVKDLSGSGGIYGALKKGEPINFAQRIWQSFTGATPEAQAVRSMGLYDDIAAILTRVQGQNAKDALNLIELARRGKALSSDQAWIVARAATTPAAIGMYEAIQSGQIRPTQRSEARYGRQAEE